MGHHGLSETKHKPYGRRQTPTILLNVPWSRRCHPEAEKHVEDAFQAMVSFGAIDGDDSLEAARVKAFARLNPYVYAYASAERLRIVATLTHWLFLLDDQFDDCAEFGKDLTAVKALMQRSLAILSYGDLPAEPTGLDRFTAYSRDLIRSVMTDDEFGHLLEDVRDYLFLGSLVAAEHWAEGRVPSAKDYAAARVHDSGALLVMHMIRIASEVHLPRSVLDHQAVRSASDFAVQHISFVNDIVSYHKEIVVNKGLWNLVHSKMVTEDRSYEDAMFAAVNIANHCVSAFQDAERSLPSWNTKADADVRAYFSGMKTWMRGNLDFAVEGDRYHLPCMVLHSVG